MRILVLLTLTCWFPYEVLSSTSLRSEGHAAPQSEYIEAGDEDGGSVELLQQFKAFLDFQKHQSEFLAWRQSKTEEVANFNIWLFPNHGAHRSQSASSMRKPAEGAFLSSTTDKKVTLVSICGKWLRYLHNLLGENPIRIAKSLLQRRLKQHQENPFEIFSGVAVSWVCDFFFLILAIMIVLAYCNSGVWGVCKVPFHLLENCTLYIAHAVLGDTVLEPPWQRGELKLRTGNIVDDGVAKPAQMMYRSKWEDLTVGQEYVLGDVLKLDSVTWEKIRQESEASEWSIPAPTDDWSTLTQYQRKCLRAIGFCRGSWDLDDPENLKIDQKLWRNMSNFERQEAIAAGIDVPRHGIELWNDREAEIFRKPYDEIDAKLQVHLRNMGFLREYWIPAAEPEVPSSHTKSTWRHALEEAANEFIGMLVALQLLFMCWLLYELGILTFFWENFFVYAIIIFVVFAVTVNIIRCTLGPAIQSRWKAVGSHIIVIVTHSKDIWNKVQIMLSFLSKVYREQCEKCHNAECCAPAPVPLMQRSATLAVRATTQQSIGHGFHCLACGQ